MIINLLERDQKHNAYWKHFQENSSSWSSQLRTLQAEKGGRMTTRLEVWKHPFLNLKLKIQSRVHGPKSELSPSLGYYVSPNQSCKVFWDFGQKSWLTSRHVCGHVTCATFFWGYHVLDDFRHWNFSICFKNMRVREGFSLPPLEKMGKNIFFIWYRVSKKHFCAKNL